MGNQRADCKGQPKGRPVQKAHWLCIGVLLDHGQVGVQANAHCGIEGHLEGGPVVLGTDHGPQLLAVHGLLHFLEELLESLLVIVSLELQSNVAVVSARDAGESRDSAGAGDCKVGRGHCLSPLSAM